MPTHRITDPLEPGKLYHIYNRGIAKSKIFFTDANYQHFTNKYMEYLSECVKTYAYCFIPNHFHFLIQVKESNGRHNGVVASQQFRKFFSSYAMSINKQQKRNGSLFQKPFRRDVVSSARHLKRLVFYIHNNPVKHHLTFDFRNFKHSSYQEIVRNSSALVDTQTVLSWFNDLNEFEEYHEYFSED